MTFPELGSYIVAQWWQYSQDSNSERRHGNRTEHLSQVIHQQLMISFVRDPVEAVTEDVCACVRLSVRVCMCVTGCVVGWERGKP